MRKLSTKIGVYAILLIAAFYGSLSVVSQAAKTASHAEIITRQAVISTEKKTQTASENLHLRKNESLNAGYSAILQPNTLTAGAEQTFFNHSATIKHYINTL